MLTYWVKLEDDGWVLTLGGKRLLGPAEEQNDMLVAGCEYARNMVELDGLAIQVMVREVSGLTRPVATYGARAKKPRLV